MKLSTWDTIEVTGEATVTVRGYIRVECFECHCLLRFKVLHSKDGEVVIQVEPCGNCIEEAVAQSHGE
jgi:hypothetical protein